MEIPVKILRRPKRILHSTVFWLFLVFVLVFLAAGQARADSFTGTLATSDSTFDVIISLPTSATLVFQTYGFGGGTNAASQVISPGGFDPLLALFAGTGSTASIFNIGGDPNNPAGTSDTLSNYGSFTGCGPAGFVTIGTGLGSTICGDITMNLTLPAGTYTAVLGDANYWPNALVVPGDSTLGDGFTDATAGAFQTCNTTSDGLFCVTDTNAYALDITGLPDGGTATPTPEPSTLLLLGTGLAGLAAWRRKSFRTPTSTIHNGTTRRLKQ